jgi:hypothetical protein
LLILALLLWCRSSTTDDPNARFVFRVDDHQDASVRGHPNVDEPIFNIGMPVVKQCDGISIAKYCLGCIKTDAMLVEVRGSFEFISFKAQVHPAPPSLVL